MGFNQDEKKRLKESLNAMDVEVAIIKRQKNAIKIKEDKASKTEDENSTLEREALRREDQEAGAYHARQNIYMLALLIVIILIIWLNISNKTRFTVMEYFIILLCCAGMVAAKKKR